MPDLTHVLKTLPANIKGYVRTAFRESGDLVMKFASRDNLLVFLREHRPDLYEVLKHPQSTRWLNYIMKYIISNLKKI